MEENSEVIPNSGADDIDDNVAEEMDIADEAETEPNICATDKPSDEIENQDNESIHNEEVNITEKDDEIGCRPKIKSRKVLSSDSEAESPINNIDEDVEPKNLERASKNNSENSDDDKISNSAISETSSIKERQNSIINRISSLIDSDSGSESNEIASAPIEKPRKKKFSKKGKSKPSQKKKDAEKDDDSSSSDDILKRMNINLSNGLCDKESSASASSSSDENDLGENTLNEEQNDGPRQQRLSAKEAMEQMKIIQSESQRMAREANCSVPYHRPKQRSLQEFLNRKTVLKPSEMVNCREPKSAAAAIKMTQDELEEYMKKLSERAEEAKEFFKSATDEMDVEMEDKINENIVNENGATDGDRNNEKQDAIEQDINDELKDPVEQIEAQPIDVNEDQTDSVVTETVQEKNPEKETATEERNEFDEIDKLLQKKYGVHDEEKVATTPLNKIVKDIVVEDKSENNMSFSPILQGSANMIIDFETGSMTEAIKPGSDLLLDRLMKTTRKSVTPNSPTSISIINVENGIILKEKIQMGTNQSAPNISYLQMHESLQKQITEKRRETILKKTEEAEKQRKLEEAEYSDYEIDEDEEEIGDDDDEEEENENNNDNDVNLSDNENEASEVDEDSAIKDKNSEEDDVDADKVDDMEEDEDEEDDDLDEKKENQSTATESRKSRIIVFDDSDDETIAEKADASSNVEQPSSCLNSNKLTERLQSDNFLFSQENEKMNKSLLYTPQSSNVDDSELLDLCSGQFVTQAVMPDTQQEPTQASLQDIDDDPFRENLLLIQSSDDEDNNNTTAAKRTKKSFKKLGFSDDENEEDEDKNLEKIQNVVDEDDDDEESEIEGDEKVDKFVEYDSEENEIEVCLTKKAQKLKAKDFVENEAELSESDWGSADEDEGNLDKLDTELGDEDEFDQNKLHSELERIHMRRMLDQDAREVKILQELLLEDEENDGVGRERKFRWRNVDQFNLENDSKEDEHNLNNDSDDENEMLWRKMRFEREMLLKEKENEQTTPIGTPRVGESSGILVQSTGTAGKKINIIKPIKLNQGTSNKNSPFLITKSITPTLSKASFLMRDENTLNKLAGLTKTDSESLNFTSKNSSNFVFATLSPSVKENENSLKRKSEDGASILENESKKKKINEKPSMKKRLLDHKAFNT